MLTFVKHTQEGEIVSIIQIDSVPEGVEPWGLLSEGEEVTEVELTGKLADMELHDLHDGYTFDAGKRKLVKKRTSSSRDKPPPAS